MCGELNENDTTCLQEQLNLPQAVFFPTHDQNTLDRTMTDVADQYLPTPPVLPIGQFDTSLWVPYQGKQTTEVTLPKDSRSWHHAELVTKTSYVKDREGGTPYFDQR